MNLLSTDTLNWDVCLANQYDRIIFLQQIHLTDGLNWPTEWL